MKQEREIDLVGKSVILTRTLRNGAGDIFRKGRIMVVENKWAGWGLRGKRGRGGWWITRVNRRDFEIVRTSMKPLLVILAAGMMSGCAIGPRRLQEDCTWNRRPETTSEDVVGITGMVATLGGMAVFVPAFIASRQDIGIPALASVFVGIPLTWWAIGAFEEVPIPGNRFYRCQKDVWLKR